MAEDKATIVPAEPGKDYHEEYRDGKLLSREAMPVDSAKNSVMADRVMVEGFLAVPDAECTPAMVTAAVKAVGRLVVGG